MNNFIHVSINRYKQLGLKKRKTFFRQLFGDLVFLIQNVVLVSLGLTVDVKPLNDPRTAKYLSCGIFGCHLVGLLLKILYYKYFHIWKDMTVRVTTHGFKRGTEKTHFITWKSIAKGEGEGRWQMK